MPTFMWNINEEKDIKEEDIEQLHQKNIKNKKTRCECDCNLSLFTRVIWNEWDTVYSAQQIVGRVINLEKKHLIKK